jgi:hypothetical protein
VEAAETGHQEEEEIELHVAYSLIWIVRTHVREFPSCDVSHAEQTDVHLLLFSMHSMSNTIRSSGTSAFPSRARSLLLAWEAPGPDLAKRKVRDDIEKGVTAVGQRQLEAPCAAFSDSVSPVKPFMAASADRDQVKVVVRALLAAKFLMVDLEILS